MSFSSILSRTPFSDITTATLHSAQIVYQVSVGIEDINHVIRVLREGYMPNRLGDSIEASYAPAMVALFQTVVAQVVTDFATARDDAGKWFDALGATISNNLVTQARNAEQQRAAESTHDKLQNQLAAVAQEVQIMTLRLAQDNVQLVEALKRSQEAQSALDRKRAEQNKIKTATLALSWMPVVAATLAIVNATAEENAVKSAQATSEARRAELQQEQQALERNKTTLTLLQQQLGDTERTLAGLHSELVDLAAKNDALEQERRRLVRIQAMTNECTHTIDGALGSARTMDNMLSLANVSTAIHGLVDALAADSSKTFIGELAELDEQGFKDLDAKVALMQQAIREKLDGLALV